MKYQISYSLNNTSWTFYKEKPTSPAKNFKGNKDDVGYVTRRFNRDVTARYVRIHEVEKHNNYEACFRATVLGRRNGPLGAPVFTNQDSNTNIVAYQHEDITLDCEAVGDWLMTFTWSYKGHVIQSTNDSKLVLQNVTKDKDQGFYTCNATNKLATNLKTLHLEVKDSMEVCVKHQSLIGDVATLTVTSSTNLSYDTLTFDDATWYALYGNEGYYRLATKCPSHGSHSNAKATGHMQGSLPPVSEGIVKRKVCFHSDRQCCRHSVDILVRNCGMYYVYKLKKLNFACRAGYSFENYIEENPPRSRMFSSYKTSFALQKHVIHAFYDINDGLDCMRLCTMESACKSFNYSPARAICELNNATVDEAEIPRDSTNSEYRTNDLQNRPEFNFYKESGLIIESVEHDEF